MNKKELVIVLAEKCGTTPVEAGAFLNAFCETVASEVKEGRAIALPKFGQFVAKNRAAREMKNPATGVIMMSKSKRAVQFKPAANLKDL